LWCDNIREFSPTFCNYAACDPGLFFWGGIWAIGVKRHMAKEYQVLFDQRGSAYDRAMRRFPEARRQEFMQAIDSARLAPGMRVADLPAGGGYLQNFLPAYCQWFGHDPSQGFDHHGASSGSGMSLLPLPWQDVSMDAAISLAGLHHTADKIPVFKELHRVIKNEGRLVVSDVGKGSAVAEFLDGYVAENNSTGHEGLYIDQHTLTEVQCAGWAIESSMTKDFYWLFADLQQMASFSHQLFDLRLSTESDTLQAIDQCLGITHFANGSVGMRWSLMTIIATRS
jgi:SAM-dependent methyltransferase